MWSRYLRLLFGHSSFGQILTICIFMGGLSLGAYLAGRFSRKIQHSFRAYAWLEVGIGLGGLVFHPLYLVLTQVVFESGFRNTGLLFVLKLLGRFLPCPFVC